MIEENHMLFDFPPRDSEKTDKENAAQIERHIEPIKKWLKGKRFVKCHVVEEGGVVTFVYEEQEAAAR